MAQITPSPSNIAAAAIGKYSRVHFKVKCQCEIGKDVAILGNISLLGNFDRTKPLRLYTTPESYPIWTTVNPIVVPMNQQIQYQYCLLENGDFKTYEEYSENHNRLIVVDQTNIVVEDCFSPIGVDDNDEESKLISEVQALRQDTESLNLSTDILKSDNGKLFIVCYHLPVLVKRQNNQNEPFSITWAESLIARSSSSSVSTNVDTFWMGTISVSGDKPNESEKEYLVNKLKMMNCIPIFLDPTVAADHYQGFCKLVMWPIFHNVDQLDHIHAAWKLNSENLENLNSLQSSSNDSSSGRHVRDGTIIEWNADVEKYIEAFCKVNEIFMKELESILRPSDTLWVHDYHLMFLPKLVRSFNSNIKIVFFLHIPFPTSQIFRSLPIGTQLLQSMASADVVGFHTFDHARHFLTAMKRILGIRSSTKQGGILALQVQDREVIVTVSHVSIEVKDVQDVLEDPSIWTRAKEFKDQFQGKKVIIGLDVCQRLSGGILKLAAFEKLLTDNPGEINNIVLVQKVIRTGSRIGDEMTTSKDLSDMVARINNKFGCRHPSSQSNGLPNTSSFHSNVSQSTSSISSLENTAVSSPVVFYEEITSRNATLADRVVLWLASDVFLLTPIKEGLNLYPLEFIYVREKGGCVEHGINSPELAVGTVVASEFSNCCSLLNGSLKINPYYVLSVADNIMKALYMSPSESHQRRLRDMDFITLHPSSKWTREILSDLRHVKKANLLKSLTSQYSSSTSLASIPSTDSVDLLETSFSLKWNRAYYPELLPIRHVLKAFEGTANTSKKLTFQYPCSRVFIFDYGGTLLHKEKYDIYIKQTLSAISGRKPTDNMMRAILKLSNDPNNIILIVTGLTQLKLGNTFSHMNNICVGTSNGLVYSWGGVLSKNVVFDDSMIEEKSLVSDHIAERNRSSSSASLLGITVDDINQSSRGKRVWESLSYQIDWQAVRDIAVPIISKFTFRTNGTCQTPRIPGIGWSFFGADPQW